MKDIGANQRGVLDSLRDHGEYPGRWVWGNHSTTIKILDSLTRRGLVVVGTGTNGFGRPYTKYTLSPKVLDAITQPWPGWDEIIKDLDSEASAK